MSAFVIADIHVTDPERYREYRSLSSAAAEKYGGIWRVRGGRHETLDGDWQPDRVVVIEFPTAEQARIWWNSPEYEAAKVIRHAAAESRMILVEGV